MVDLTRYKAGIEAARSAIPHICQDPRSEFLNVLADAGFKVPRVLKIGSIDRLQGADDKGTKRSAWYIYEEITDTEAEGAVIGIGSYGDWKLDIKKNWSSRSEHKMSQDEKINYLASLEAMRVQRELDEKKRNEEAAIYAYDIWSNTDEVDAHPYLSKKKVNACTGLRIANDGRLIVPIAVDGQITSLQFIDKDGNKQFLYGGKIKGGWFVIEGVGNDVYIAEGYSTGMSVHMATGATVYIAFNAGNLYEVCSYVKSQYAGSRLIVAGDDDTKSKVNTGRAKAEAAAEGLGIDCVFANGYIDFNDMHVDLGLDAVKSCLIPKGKPYEAERRKNSEQLFGRPVGILGDISDYYNVTSGNEQYGFSIQTALATTSIILGRCFKSNLDNYTSLYLLNVAKSGTGKEHAKRVTERILEETGLQHLIAGDGYTSAGAVFSTLLDRPKHISVIDEFGRYLEAGRDSGKGDNHQRQANTKLMEAIGRCCGIIRPPSYSTMTLKKDAASAIKNRYVCNPAITLLTMTTPETLFKSLDMGAVKDGFINRFIISISEAKRAVRIHKELVDVPERIKLWVERVMSRVEDHNHVASENANPITLNFSQEAMDMQFEFQKYANVELPNNLEKFGLAEISGRSNEMAMRISVIAALSRDPNAETIEGSDMEWAIKYVRKCLDDTVKRLKVTISHSDFEGKKKEILADLRNRGANGITWSDMQKNPPYSQHKPKDLRDIMQALKDADLAYDETSKISGARGRPALRWIAQK